MENKERDVENLMTKKSTMVTVVVVVLLVLSFVALQINNYFKKPSTQVLPIVQKEQTAPSEVQQPEEPQNVKVSDVVSQEQLAKTQTVPEATTTDHLDGVLTAPVKLIVYSDFECPYCAQYHDILVQAKKIYGAKIAIIYRQYPMVQLHTYAMTAALASECADEQGKFWPMYDALFLANKENRLNADEIINIAKTLKLDTKKFDSCLSTEKYRDKVVAQFEAGKTSGVTGTPTTFVNGELVIGANPLESGLRSDGSKLEGLKSIIDRKLLGQ
jgi:protein-disulfide isomerase